MLENPSCSCELRKAVITGSSSGALLDFLQDRVSRLAVMLQVLDCICRYPPLWCLATSSILAKKQLREVRARAPRLQMQC